jgi:hypothetical protein
MSTLPPQRPLRESLFWSAVVIAVAALALLFCGRLQAGCGWSCMRGCIDHPPLPTALVC